MISIILSLHLSIFCGDNFYRIRTTRVQTLNILLCRMYDRIARARLDLNFKISVIIALLVESANFEFSV